MLLLLYKCNKYNQFMDLCKLASASFFLLLLWLLLVWVDVVLSFEYMFFIFSRSFSHSEQFFIWFNYAYFHCGGHTTLFMHHRYGVINDKSSRRFQFSSLENFWEVNIGAEIWIILKSNFPPIFVSNNW